MLRQFETKIHLLEQPNEILTNFYKEFNEHVKTIFFTKSQPLPFARAAGGQFNDLSRPTIDSND